MEAREGKEMDQQSREKRNPTDEGVHTVKSDLIYWQTLHWRAFMISLLLPTPAATGQEYFLMIKPKIPAQLGITIALRENNRFFQKNH